MNARLHVGAVFGDRTILALLPPTRVRASCTCGFTSELEGSTLLRKPPPSCPSCGWDRRRRYQIGDRHDALTITRIEKQPGRTWVHCVCDCGTPTKVRTDALRRNRTNSCGCRPGSLWKGHEEISLSFFHRIRKGAATRGIPFDVSIMHLQDLLRAQNHRCKLSDIPIHLGVRVTDPSTASVDRIDSTRGYVPGNVQWVHKVVNRMKGSLPEGEFLTFCQRIADFTPKLGARGAL